MTMMMWLMIWCSLIFVEASRIGSRGNSNENRILNGKEVEAGKFLFVPQLSFIEVGRNDDGCPLSSPLYVCTSTIISKRHILTAAHCVYMFYTESDPSKPLPKLGASPSLPVLIDIRPNDVGKWYDIHNFGLEAKTYFHRSWGQTLQYHGDIAIIELSEGADIGIPPVTLAADYKDDYKTETIATGYGLYKFDSNTNKALPDHPPELQSANVSVHPIRDCYMSNKTRELYDHDEWAHKLIELAYDPKRLLCAGKYLQRADHGDSGGPLLIDVNGTYYQIGVVTGGGMYDEPTLYSRVSYYCGWIEMVTKGEVKCQPLHPVPNPKALINFTANYPVPTVPNPEALIGVTTSSSEITYVSKIIIMCLGFFFILM